MSYISYITLAFPSSSNGKAFACKVGDPRSIPGSRRSPGEGNGNPYQHPCLENPMDRGALQATVHEVTQGQTWLSDKHTHHIFSFNLFHLIFCDQVSVLSIYTYFMNWQTVANCVLKYQKALSKVTWTLLYFYHMRLPWISSLCFIISIILYKFKYFFNKCLNTYN